MNRICFRLENLVGDLEQPSYRHFGSGSGGYAVNVLRVAAERLFNIHLSPEVVDDPFVITRNLGNTDIQVSLNLVLVDRNSLQPATAFKRRN